MMNQESFDALRQSVEILGGMQIQTEKELQQLIQNVDKLRGMMATLADAMTQLTRITIDHSERIEHLENRKQ